MALILKTYTFPAHIVLSGDAEDVAISAGQWLQIRSGTIAAPEDTLLVQCPAGKAWKARIRVEIVETDA